ncbi:DUF3168 domain-containing protein [Methylobacterium gnaphalii]|uniref:DUF3168 domain-containing protein n=1 Tax=Methylobacterium gnaphalii TaxID=1010610 RepID=A0A512JQM3_9HYPH|nr:DUF3168 domain-containing protein [Methylobacterium gnaphalii]GEP12256.1 hypothetical protein MGN01_41010 [Methylobacterium gnaphalii]GJD68740.1 hypothetical protein MMMDOFMJ_1664 [Methylobacterium gnaphalii]GLS49363.1 hypothetical protein GCM10007885_22110 [Methylobacterium gnaphalii]
MAELPLTPETALLDAVKTLLQADAGFSALAGKKIYDEIPAAKSAGDNPPYAYFGPMRRSRVESGCGEFWTVQARIYAVSTSFGRRQGWALIDAIATALNLQEVVLAAPFVQQQPFIVTQGGDVVDPLAARQVFVDVTTTIGRSDPAQED